MASKPLTTTFSDISFFAASIPYLYLYICDSSCDDYGSVNDLRLYHYARSKYLIRPISALQTTPFLYAKFDFHVLDKL